MVNGSSSELAYMLEQTSVVLERQASTIELPFSIFDQLYVCVHQCLYVNEILNLICSS